MRKHVYGTLKGGVERTSRLTTSACSCSSSAHRNSWQSCRHVSARLNSSANVAACGVTCIQMMRYVSQQAPRQREHTCCKLPWKADMRRSRASFRASGRRLRPLFCVLHARYQHRR